MTAYVNFNCSSTETQIFFVVGYLNRHEVGKPHCLEIFASEEEHNAFYAKMEAIHGYSLYKSDFGMGLKKLNDRIAAVNKENSKIATGTDNPLRPVAAKKNICRTSIMRRAHEIARTLQGDRAACMSFALKQAWAEAKA